MKPIILMTVALGCGLVAAIGVFKQMGKNSAASSQEKPVKVVVAAREININEPLTEENVKVVDWPADQKLQGAASEVKDLEGKYARVRLYPGEPILDGKIMGITDASSSLRVPKGYRVVSVKVSLDSSVSNLIEPGDRVDVIAVIRPSRENPTAVAKTILKAVRVFAINSEIVRSLDPDKSPEEARTVSLLLKPEQAEKLMMATELGKIKLAMRSPEDAQLVETSGCTVGDVLGRADVADEVEPTGQLALCSTPQPTNVNEGPAYWAMVVSSPGNAQKFTWATPDAMPKMEVLYSSDKSSSDKPSDDAQDDASGDDSGDLELDSDIQVTDYRGSAE